MIWLCSDPVNPCRLRKRKGNSEFRAQKGQEQQMRRKKMGSKLEGPSKSSLAEAGDEQHHHSRLQPLRGLGRSLKGVSSFSTKNQAKGV